MVPLGGGATDVYWAEARDAAKTLWMPRASPAQGHLAGEVEGLQSNGSGCAGSQAGGGGGLPACDFGVHTAAVTDARWQADTRAGFLRCPEGCRPSLCHQRPKFFHLLCHLFFFKVAKYI